MRELTLTSVVSELLARHRLSRGLRMPLILGDILNGTFTYSVYLYAPALQQLIASGHSDLEHAYAEFRYTNLNPLSAVYRPGVVALSNKGPAQRLADLPAKAAPDVLKTCKQVAIAAVHQAPPWQGGSLAHSRCRQEAHEHSACAVEHKIETLIKVAQFLNLETSFTFRVLQVLEAAGHHTLPDVAGHLACSPRTLERHLHDEGTSVETLRSAVRLLRANAQLRSGEHLSTVALTQGFSDQAHMNRCFMQACGLTPRALQRLYTGKLPAKSAAPSAAQV